MCPYAHRFDKKSNKRYLFLRRYSLCLNVLNDSNRIISVFLCLGNGGGASSKFRRRSLVCLKFLHSIHIKAKLEKHIHNTTTIFYSYGCISINDLPLIMQPSIPTRTLAAMAELVRSLYFSTLNHSIISPLCLV